MIGCALKVARLVDRVADATNTEGGGIRHGPFGHVVRSPELELIGVGVFPHDRDTLFACRGRADRVEVGHTVLVQASQMGIDVLGPNVESVTRKSIAESRRGWEWLWSEHGSVMAARGEVLKRDGAPTSVDWRLCADHSGHEVGPAFQIRAGDHVVIDPEQRAWAGGIADVHDLTSTSRTSSRTS